MDMDIKNYGLILLACISGVLNAANLVYLENESNGTIAYQVNTRDVKYINHGVRHFLGNISLDKRTPLALVKTLQISGSWMWSRYAPLGEYLRDIRAEQTTACGFRGPRCYQNAIIRIKPSGIASGWHVDVTWENSGKIEEFDMNSFK